MFVVTENNMLVTFEDEDPIGEAPDVSAHIPSQSTATPAGSPSLMVHQYLTLSMHFDAWVI